MGYATTDDSALVAEPGRGEAEVVVEVIQVGGADVAQLDVLEVGPDAFVGIELGRVTGQLLEAQAFGATLRQELFDRPGSLASLQWCLADRCSTAIAGAISWRSNGLVRLFKEGVGYRRAPTECGRR